MTLPPSQVAFAAAPTQRLPHGASERAPADEVARLWTPRAAFRKWWQSRLPLTDTWTLGQRNVYIMPSRAGLMFGLTLIVMLLASINYELNLGFALTFLLAGAGLVSMHLTHGNLRGLTLHLRQPGAVFTGDPALMDVVVTNPGAQRHALALRFEDHNDGGAVVWCDAPSGGQTVVQMAVVPSRRGWNGVPPLVVETVFPFGLFRAWTVWRPAARVLAWPRPESAPPALPTAASALGAQRPQPRSQGGELDGVRPWRRGDTMRQVVWKKLARSGELVSRDTEATVQHELWLDWVDAGESDPERRLSRLTAWVLRAEREGHSFGLRLPGQRLDIGEGEAQRRRALDQLALW